MPERLDGRQARRIENLSRLGEDVIFGRVEIDPERCRGCGLCAEACAADAIVVTDGAARMREGLDGQCMACGDCAAICPEGAIAPARFIEFKCRFRYLDRGDPHPPRRF
ncbi:MAG: 4Fe-4S dicluster domain-containing protein [Proteobacteria bacterium]|nr:4Fe-4S dicluster domain-containing protein [Pseudomonadota bacterium]